MSGFKLNIDKTKAIWIGSLNKSNRRFCREYKLDWDQEPFKILGVTFTFEVLDIWDKNATDILKQVKYPIKAWPKRKLTLQGKITIIKSLALSKFVNLFLFWHYLTRLGILLKTYTNCSAVSYGTRDLTELRENLLLKT